MSTNVTEKSFSSQTTIITGSTPYIPKAAPVTLLQRIQWLGNILYYQVVAVLTFVMFWIMFATSEKKNVMFYHMILSMGAYIPLMAIAIIAFSKDNLPTQLMQRKRIYWVHGVLLTISCVAVTIGCAVEVHAKPARHFKSNHAILGLASWVIVLATSLIGLVAGNTQPFSRFVKPLLVKLIHNFLGISAFVLGVASLVLMYKSRHFKSHLSTNALHATYYATGYIVVWSLLTAFKSLAIQAKGVFC